MNFIKKKHFFMLLLLFFVFRNAEIWNFSNTPERFICNPSYFVLLPNSENPRRNFSGTTKISLNGFSSCYFMTSPCRWTPKAGGWRTQGRTCGGVDDVCAAGRDCWPRLRGWRELWAYLPGHPSARVPTAH